MVCKCKICNNEFKPKAPNGSLCSVECKIKNKKLIMLSFKKANPTYFNNYEKINKQHISELHKAWYDKNREHKAFSNKEWSLKNKEYQKLRNKNYYLANKDRLIEQCRVYSLNRRQIDPIYKMTKNLRKRLNFAIKNNQKSGSAIRDLGCTVEELRTYLESKFTEGMTWGNYGKWHIDHIIPLNSFDLSDSEQLKKACHYTNLQPLWVEVNIAKSDTV